MGQVSFSIFMMNSCVYFNGIMKCMRWKSNDNLLNRFGLTGFKMEQTLLVEGKIKAKIKKDNTQIARWHWLDNIYFKTIAFCPLIFNQATTLIFGNLAYHNGQLYSRLCLTIPVLCHLMQDNITRIRVNVAGNSSFVTPIRL